MLMPLAYPSCDKISLWTRLGGRRGREVGPRGGDPRTGITPNVVTMIALVHGARDLETIWEGRGEVPDPEVG